MSKVMRDYLVFAFFCPAIGLENVPHPLNQLGAKRNPISTRFP